MLFSGMSINVVTPPAAAARVAVSKPSQSVRPGSLICTCVSTRPGMTIAVPASIIRSAVVEATPSLGLPGLIDVIRPLSMRIVAGRIPSGSPTRSPRMIHEDMQLARERGFDQTVWLFGGHEDLVAILHPEPRQIDGQVMPIRHLETDARDHVNRVEHHLSHRVERVLHRKTVMPREGVEQRRA